MSNHSPLSHLSPSDIDRREFRAVLCAVVSCLREQLAVPGVSPFSPEELARWFHSIEPADIQAVWK